jgi:uncharacterized protein
MRKLDDTDFDCLTRVLRESPDLLAGYCFGSQTDPGRASPRDLDIAVLGTGRLTLRRLLELRATIAETIASDRVDLIDLRQAGPVLKRQVIKSRHPLFVRDQSLVNAFELQALREYQDSAYRRRVQFHYLSAGRGLP